MNLISEIWNWLGNNIAEIIGLCALVFTAYQAYILRKHNKLSVRPHLSDFNERSRSENESTLAFKIVNNGLGPAEITDWSLQLNGEELKYSEHETVENLINNVLGGRVIGFTIGALGVGYMMPINEIKTILNLRFKVESEENFDSILNSFDGLDLIVEYKSMYGDFYTLDTRKGE